MNVDEIDKDFRLLRERLAGAVTVTEWDAIVRLQYSAQRAIRERNALREALPDPDKLDMLANWFDHVQRSMFPHWGDDREVQHDLRRWAKNTRDALEALGEEVGGG